MVDSGKKEILKIVWLPDDELIFYASDDRPLPLNSDVYRRLAECFDVLQWRFAYSQAYTDWLNGDNAAIYNINDTLNLSIIDALIKLNESLDHQIIYYWFDADRSVEDFFWDLCPLSGKKLLPLGKEYCGKNALISPRFPLIFPDYRQG
jgi:hypothetical protein